MTETADINVRSLLEAARRAEAEGNVEAAMRALRHITENYPRSTEARLAAEALARRQNALSHASPAMPPPGRLLQTQRPPQASAHPSAQPSAQPSAMTLPTPAGPPPARHPQPQPHATAPVPHRAASHAAAPAQSAHHAHRPQPHQPAVAHYRFGRLIAHLTGFIGAAILIAAIAAAALNLGATFGYVSSPVFASMLIGWPLILVTNALGLFLVLLSQMARATFDAADAAARPTHLNH